MKTKRVILCGLGNVGKAFLRLVQERSSAVQSKYGLRIEIGGVVDIGGAAIAREGDLPLPELFAFLQGGGRPEQFPGYGVPGLAGEAAIQAGEYALLVETTPTNLKTGEPGRRFIEAAIGKGMDVVSADKGPFVLYFDQLQTMAAASGSQAASADPGCRWQECIRLRACPEPGAQPRGRCPAGAPYL